MWMAHQYCPTRWVVFFGGWEPWGPTLVRELLRSMVIVRPYFIPLINGSGWTKCFGMNGFFPFFFWGLSITFMGLKRWVSSTCFPFCDVCDGGSSSQTLKTTSWIIMFFVAIGEYKRSSHGSVMGIVFSISLVIPYWSECFVNKW